MGFTPVNGGKPDASEGNGPHLKRTKKSTKMLAKIPNPRPLHTVNASQTQPQQPNPFAYAQQRGRANPALDPSFLKRPPRSPPRPPREHVAGLREVPTLYPNHAEFADPNLYLSSLNEFENYGMVKIVPPDNWLPPLALDTELFTFRSKHQLINQTVDEDELRAEFNAALEYFHEKNSKRASSSFKIPLIHKRPLNMYLLHRSVQLRGGINEVSRKKLWQQIGRELGYSGKIMSSLSTSLRNSYQKILTPFDDYLRENGVNLSSSPRIVRYKISPDAVPKEGEIKLPIGILITMDCSPENWTPQKLPEISNSHTPRIQRPQPLWAVGKYAPLNASEQDASYNLKQFQTKASSFNDTYFRTEVNEQEIESEYWRLLKSPGECLDVEYGYSMTSASGFRHDWKNLWNFNAISMLDSSYLRYIDDDLMSHPRLDVGMLFASKAWASEPYFGSKLSISHLGAVRTWYSIPPQYFTSMCDIVDVRHNRYMATPEQLSAKGVPCYVTDQHPGEIIVIFPKSWHSHFNHGFNLNESVNFLPKDWLETGKLALKYYSDLKLPAPFSLDELLLVTSNCNNCDLLVHVAAALKEMYERELSFQKFTRSGKPFEPQICVKTNQKMVVSWVETPDGPVDPAVAESGTLHAVYGDVDEFFKKTIGNATSKLEVSKDFIKEVCTTLTERHRIPKDVLVNIISKDFDANKCRTLKGLLKNQIVEGEKLSKTAHIEGKVMLDTLDSMLDKYKQIVCEVPELSELQSVKDDYEKFVADLQEFMDKNTKGATIETFLDRSHGLKVLSPVQDAILLIWNNIVWANKITGSLGAPPIMFLHQIDGILMEAAQLGIDADSPFVQFINEKKQAGITLNSRAERVAFWEKVDPKELDFILDQAVTTPIDEQVYARLTLFKSVHSVIEAMYLPDVPKRPRLTEAAKYRVINAQVGEAVSECEQWLASFVHPDQVIAQIEAAAVNGPLYMLMQVHLQTILQILPRLNYLSVIPDNYEAWMRARQILNNLVNSHETDRLRRYGFV